MVVDGLVGCDSSDGKGGISTVVCYTKAVAKETRVGNGKMELFLCL